MCGIAGIVWRARPGQDPGMRLERMVREMRHRGPDDGGVECVCKGAGTPAWFGHARLAIIDTSSTGHQPMRDPLTGCWITFNGEIYNFPSLREELARMGHEFRTRTDTEVILKAYAEWGAGCAARLRGMFAFAVWDPAEGHVYCARDHVGIKPFYYYLDEGVFIFASEVRAVLASGLVRREVDAYGLNSYLSFGSVQEPFTLVKGVRSLAPGDSLTIKDGRAETRSYWKIGRREDPRVGAMDEGELHEALRERLTAAVGSQMISDVPLGAFLSGGIDSTAIAALMRASGASSVSTFSLVFDEAAYDERAYSRLAAERIGTSHVEMTLGKDEVLGDMGSAMAAYDQPSADGLNTYYVSRLARRSGLTVSLSGVGGDELFVGYDGFGKPLALHKMAAALNRLPAYLRGPLSSGVGFLGDTERVRRVRELIRGDFDPYFVSRMLFTGEQIRGLLDADALASHREWMEPWAMRVMRSLDGFDPVDRISALELQTYMLSTLLRDADQMSMAHSLEVRVPLLDVDLIDFMFSVPSRRKVEGNWPKPLLTRALAGMVPRECVFRPKRGFTLPFEIWLRQSLMPVMEAFFLGGDQPAVFDGKGLESLWRRFLGRNVSWSRVWSVYVLGAWLERHRIM